MKRALTTWVAVALAVLAAGQAAGADRNLSTRTVKSYVFGQLPAIRLVVRSQDAFLAMGAAGLVEIDFKREMGLLVSLGPEKQNVEGIRIKWVKDCGDKIVVETQRVPFEELLAGNVEADAYHFVVVERSELPVEGFVDKMEPCPGLCAISTLAVAKKQVDRRYFLAKAEGRGYEALRVKEMNPMIERWGWMHSVCFDATPGGGGRVGCRVLTLKSGEGTVVKLEVNGCCIGAGPKRAVKECPADVKMIEEGLRGAFDVSDRLYQQAAEQIVFGYPVSRDPEEIHFPAIWKSDIDEERFRKHIKSDKTKFVPARGEFLDTLDEVGTGGSFRWKKPYVKAVKTIEGVGKVIVGYCPEFNLARFRVDEVQTTDMEKLRLQIKKSARDCGVRFEDDALEGIQLSFYVVSRR